MHELNLEYMRKSGEINRNKDLNISDKEREIDQAHRLYLDAKRDALNVISEIRHELYEATDEQVRDCKRGHIRTLEQRLGMMKEEYLLEVEHIRANHYDVRRQLDDEARNLSYWLEEEKLKVMKEACYED